MSNEIEKISSDFERDSYFRQLSDMTGFDFSNRNQRKPVQRSMRQAQTMPQTLHKPDDGRAQSERAILWMMFVSKNAAMRFKNEIGFFSQSLYNQLSLYIYDVYRKQDRIESQDVLLARIQDDKLRDLCMQLWQDEHRLLSYDETYFNDALNKIHLCQIQDAIDELNSKIRMEKDIEKKKVYVDQRRDLLNRRTQIRRQED